MYIDNLTHPDLGIAVIEDDTNTSKSLTKRLLALMKAYLKGNNDEAEFLAIDGAEFWDIKSENITIDEIKEELNLKVRLIKRKANFAENNFCIMSGKNGKYIIGIY